MKKNTIIEIPKKHIAYVTGGAEVYSEDHSPKNILIAGAMFAGMMLATAYITINVAKVLIHRCL